MSRRSFEATTTTATVLQPALVGEGVPLPAGVELDVVVIYPLLMNKAKEAKLGKLGAAQLYTSNKNDMRHENYSAKKSCVPSALASCRAPLPRAAGDRVEEVDPTVLFYNTKMRRE